VEICKAYGGTEGYKFINGILDKLAQELRPNDPGRLNKAQA
ncbi:MAG: N utilization substance protein B, partial [Neisseriaceae bacterium]|nr:N utilization substance protein B [Neisseriaceae bacterium]